MTLRKNFLVSAVATSLAAAGAMSATAVAQANPAITTGAQVVDTEGGAVGTVAGIQGDIVIVRTNSHEVGLRASAFTPHEGHLIIGLTQAELNAAAEQAAQQADASIEVGAVVRDTAGGRVGTIENLDQEYVTLRVSNGLVKLPKTAIAGTPNGPVSGMTAAELEAQLAGGSGR